MLLSDDGNNPTALFTTSWFLTLFSHDIETFEIVCRLFDFSLSCHPLMLVYVCVGVILECKDRLEEQALEDQASASFVVFRTPLDIMKSVDNLDNILLRALQIE